MTIATLDQLVAGLSAGSRLSFCKQPLAVNTIGLWASYWTVGGQPGAGAVPPSGAGEVPTNATAGALPFVNPTGGASSYLAGLKGGGALLWLCDRLVHTSGLSGTLTTAQTVNSAAVNRPDSSGAGAELFLEIYSAIGTGTQTATVSYTNQSGTAGRSTTVQVGGSTGLNQPSTVYPVSLASGDTGVRSVQSVTLAGSTGTAGNFGVTIARKIAGLMILAAPLTAARDPFSLGLPALPNNACLFALGMGSVASGIEAMITVAQA